MSSSIRLGDVATYINGYAFKPEDRGAKGLPIIRIQDLTGNSYDLAYYEGSYPEKIEINDGDILISWSASLGVYIWSRGKALLNQHIFKVVFDKEPIDESYFVFAVRHRLNEMINKTHGATMKHIVKKDFENTVIPYPPINEQKNVAMVLRRAEIIIEKRKRELAQLDELIKARFVELFGDETNPLGWQMINVEEVADVSVGVVIKPAQYYTDAEHGVKAFRSLNIGPNMIKDSDWVYFSKEGNEKNSKSQLRENDLLIVRSGTPGTACVVPREYEGCNAIDIIIARPDVKQVNPLFLCAYTNMLHGKRQIREGVGGAAQQHFNVGKYKKLKLMLPPKSKQDQFVDIVKQVDKSKFS